MLLTALLATAELSHTVYLGTGHAESAFRLHEPVGVILLFRATVPHGANVRIDGRIPGVAGVSLATTRRLPSLACRRHGATDVCVQQEEWCPMPEATWRFRVTKTTGPAGPIRVDFVVGNPPSRP